MARSDSLASFGHEIKYVLSTHKVRLVSAWLNCLCRRDPKHPEGIVASIYYDTRELHMLREKVDSDYLKTKIRVRWYHDAKHGGALGRGFAEAKHRIGTRRTKERMEIPVEADWLARQPLTSPELVRLPGALASRGVTFDRPLSPLITVSYRRLRFIDPLSGTRVALDWSIRTGAAHPRLRPGVVHPPVPTAVLEFKGDSREVPPALKPVAALGIERSSFSKYSACAIPGSA